MPQLNNGKNRFNGVKISQGWRGKQDLRDRQDYQASG
jgi:hypothetical protein